MIDNTDISNHLALDVQSLGGIRRKAATDPQQGLRDVAQQFEALLLDSMLKSMRQAGGEGGIFDSEQSRMFTGLLDQQMAQKMAAGHGLGLADMILKQIQQAQQASTAGQGALNNGSDVPLTK